MRKGQKVPIQNDFNTLLDIHIKTTMVAKVALILVNV